MSDPTVIAHRGFAGLFPENTVAAVEGAVELGADAVEIDVQPTADGDVVVVHDSRLDGAAGERALTDGSGVVWEQPTADVTEARVLETDERVPLFATVLSAIPERVTVNVELKNPGTDAVRPGESLGPAERTDARERWAGFVESVLAVTDRFDHDVLFSSFCEGALAAIAAVAPTERRAALVAPNCADAGATVARRYDVDAIHPPVSQVGTGSTIDWAAVAEDVDAALNVWTVQDWLDARTALREGADGILADYPHLPGAL